jgi:hypothetical protein
VPPGEPVLAPTSHYELVLGEIPLAHPVAPVAAVMSQVPPDLEERLRKLEGLLTQMEQLQALQRAAPPHPSHQLQQQPAPAPVPAGPSVLGQARALIEAGRHLLPNLPPGIAPPPNRRWLIWEMIAEARAMLYMYVDPRYRMAWYGYVVPPLLFVAYLISYYWVPFSTVFGRLLTVPVDVVLLYSMFKVLGHEARRYRETAPDLPPNLRL